MSDRKPLYIAGGVAMCVVGLIVVVLLVLALGGSFLTFVIGGGILGGMLGGGLKMMHSGITGSEL